MKTERCRKLTIFFAQWRPIAVYLDSGAHELLEQKQVEGQDGQSPSERHVEAERRGDLCPQHPHLELQTDPRIRPRKAAQRQHRDAE